MHTTSILQNFKWRWLRKMLTCLGLFGCLSTWLIVENLSNHLGQFKNNNGIRLAAVLWHDNKPVSLLSTFVGGQPVYQQQRYDLYTKRASTKKEPEMETPVRVASPFYCEQCNQAMVVTGLSRLTDNDASYRVAMPRALFGAKNASDTSV